MNYALHQSPGEQAVGAAYSGYSVQRPYRNSPERESHSGENQMRSLGTVTRKFRGRDPRNILSKTDTADLVKEALRAAYGESRSIAKEVAEDSGQSPKAAENWLAGDNPMGLTAFLNAYRNNETFKAWARKILLLEEEIDPAFQAQLAQFINAVKRT